MQNVKQRMLMHHSQMQQKLLRGTPSLNGRDA